MFDRPQRQSLGRPRSTQADAITTYARSMSLVARTVALAGCLALLTAAAAPAAVVVGPGTPTAVAWVQSTGDGAAWVGARDGGISKGYGGVPVRTTYLDLLWGRPGFAVAQVAVVGERVDDGSYPVGRAVLDVNVSGTLAVVVSEPFSISKGDLEHTRPSRVDAFDLPTHARRLIVDCGEDRAASAALSGSLVATACWRPPRYVDPLAGAPVEVRDLQQPAGSPPQTIAADAVRVELAGSRLAWQTADGGLVVFDLARRAEILRLSKTMLPGLGAWDVQADGKIAAVIEGNRIAWASPTDGQLRVITSPPPAGGLRLVGDRLAFVRRGAQDEAVLRPLEGPERVVARYDASGDVSPYTGGASVDAGPDVGFDGRALVWARRHCDTTEVVRATADEPTDVQRVDFCPLQIDATRSETVDRRGRLTTRVTCPRLVPSLDPDRCQIVATIRIRGRSVVTRRTLKPGVSGRLRFPASKHLRTARPRKLTVRYATTMRGGTDRRQLTLRPSYPVKASR